MKILFSIFIFCFLLISPSLWALNCPPQYDYDAWYESMANNKNKIKLVPNPKETKEWKKLTSNQKIICEKETEKALEKKYGKDWLKKIGESIDREQNIKGNMNLLRSAPKAIFAGIIFIILILGCVRFFKKKTNNQKRR